MEKELLNSDKELLLKDLCARLPYGVKCKLIYNNKAIKDEDATLVGVDKYAHFLFAEFGEDTRKFVCKPYLFPLSGMTEEQLKGFYATIRPVIEEALDAWKFDKTEYEGGRPITLKDIKADIVAVNWMLKNHFDMNGLIEKGLAIDCTNLNIY